jgi:hypothetical protein
MNYAREWQKEEEEKTADNAMCKLCVCKRSDKKEEIKNKNSRSPTGKREREKERIYRVPPSSRVSVWGDSGWYEFGVYNFFPQHSTTDDREGESTQSLPSEACSSRT